MKKLSKSALIITVVTALLFAVAVTALAASWSDYGEFKNKGGSGNYGVGMTLTENRAHAAMEITNYKGIIQEGGGAQIEGCLVNEDGNVIGNKYYYSGEPKNNYDAYLNFEANDPSAVVFRCKFTFYEFTIIDHSMSLS